MKKEILYTAVLLLVLPLLAVASNPGDTVFAGIKIHTINIRFPRADYWDSLAYYYAQGNEQEIMATAIVNGVVYDSIGVRFKGNSSYSYPNNKKSFKINFDQYKANPILWDNLKAVHLNNMYADPSFMREKIHLDFCRDAGVTAPRANYAMLYINDTLFAFYSLVEHVDKTFLTTQYANKKGDLFKAVDGIVNADYISDFCRYGGADSCYYNLYELKTDGSTTAWPYLRAVIDTLAYSSKIATLLSALVNMNSLYKAIATDILFSNLDSYINSGRNFYMYFLPTTNKMQWICWDVGLSFGAYTGGVTTPEIMSATYCISRTDRPLVGKIFNTDTLKSAYLHVLDTLYKNYFSVSRISAHIDSVAGFIRAYVDADARKMYTTAQFTTNITSDITVSDGTGTRKPGLKSFLSARSSSIATQLALLITSIKQSSANTVPSSFALAQNYPNPFNPSTTIMFSLPEQSEVRLEVFNLLGEQVAMLMNSRCSAGMHSIVFNAPQLSSGLYFYKLSAGAFSSTRKLVLLK
jgi:spore coat protein CotH